MIRIILMLLSASLTSGLVFAQETSPKARWYQVNITVFKQKADFGLDEAFAAEPISITEADLIQLKKAPKLGTAESAYNAPLALNHEAVGPQAPFLQQNIDDEWERILSKLDPVSQPILYNMQWVQPVYDKKHAVPLYFESSTSHLGQPQLRGIMHLNVSRYLHTEFDLNFWPENAESPEQMVSLKQARRMRSKELHYLDHPLVGILVRMLPAKNPLEDTENKNAKSALTAKL